MTRRSRILVAGALALALASAGAAAQRLATRGVSQTNGWGPVALSVAPNGTRVAVTGIPDATAGGTLPNGARVTLDTLPESRRPFRDGLVVY
jgi:hypothetical protein